MYIDSTSTHLNYYDEFDMTDYDDMTLLDVYEVLRNRIYDFDALDDKLAQRIYCEMSNLHFMLNYELDESVLIVIDVSE